MASERIWLLLGPDTSVVETEDEGVVLPEGWLQQPVDEDDRLIFQASKLVSEAGLVPSVTVLFSVKPSDVTAQEYTQQLVEAAEAGLSQLQYEENDFSESDGLAVRRLRGQYIQGEEVVGLKQQIYIQNDDVYTFTGIFTPDTPTSSEVEIIFDQVLANLIGW